MRVIHLDGCFLRQTVPEPKPAAPADDLARHDVTQFRYLETLFGSLPDVLPAALIAVNQHGLIVLANQQTAAMFGYPHEELLGAPVELLMPSRYRSGHVERRLGSGYNQE